MASQLRRIPPGPAEKYAPDRDLLVWLGEQFARYGDIFRESIHGTERLEAQGGNLIGGTPV